MASISTDVGGLDVRRTGRGLPRVSWGTALCVVILLVVGAAVLFPLFLIVRQSFDVSKPGEAARFGLDGWAAIFSERGLRTAVNNTLLLSITRQAIALPIAIGIAWLIARTDLPGSRWFEFGFWLSFFLPTLTVTLSWILVLDPDYGLFNQLIRPTGLHFNIYSFWGIVWTHLVAHNISVMVMLLTPAFRNMNSSFEEASRVAGASTLSTIWRIFVPVMMPAILAVELIVLMRSLESFEVEQILGPPISFQVMATWIYATFYQQTPRIDAASALAVVLVACMLLFVVIQQRFIGKRRYTTVTGQFQGQIFRLGAARVPALVFMGIIMFLIMGVPFVFATMGTFMKLFGYFTNDPWTLQHWQTAFREPLLLRSLQNTLILATATAAASVLLNSLIAYVIVRTRFFGRHALDFITWLPFTVPGILLSLGLLTMFLLPPLRPIYGSIYVLILAGVISGMPLAVQITKSNLMQLGAELEEASWLTGGSWWHTYRRVVLPLLRPTLVVVALISFIGAARNVAQVALLSNAQNRPLSMLQLDYMAEGKFEVAAVVACCILFLTVGLALVARAFGYRAGAGG
ncbi:MAG TPA: iron ABC transporter permease [Chloroflexota bacterium]|nr:iron ABC transporter permease [Chloroflexota bacterium]